MPLNSAKPSTCLRVVAWKWLKTKEIISLNTHLEFHFNRSVDLHTLAGALALQLGNFLSIFLLIDYDVVYYKVFIDLQLRVPIPLDLLIFILLLDHLLSNSNRIIPSRRSCLKPYECQTWWHKLPSCTILWPSGTPPPSQGQYYPWPTFPAQRLLGSARYI